MAYNTIGGLPPQQLPFNRKNKKWRKSCVDCGDSFSLMNYDLTYRSVQAMNINYDLMRGRIHMDDLKALVNPFGIDASFIPDGIQHYDIIHPKIEVLKGEESKRLFDFRVIVTNPNAISEIEEEKNRQINQRLQQLIMDESVSENDFQRELEKLSDYFTFEYQDKREVRGNLILNHYIKELEVPQMFNRGFDDKIKVDEEIYQCDIVGGEPYIERLDPRDVRIITSGNSNKVEDADMIVIDQYWNKGRIFDTYWDQLSKKDREELEEMSVSGRSYADSMDNINDAQAYRALGDWVAGDAVIDPNELFTEGVDKTRGPWDMHGNIRVLRVYWKSRRKIKKVKSYDFETGEETFNFYPETYIPKVEKGEEEEIFWVNEAWEGTKIGSNIYLNMRPRPVQYNRLSNPSKCHFGIIGSIGSTRNDRPYSLVDIMKPYAYLYDVMHDRLNKTLARNHGKLVKMDFAKTPDWPVDKWLYYITTHGILVEDSFKEGDKGRSTGVLGGQMNNASTGVVDASLGNEIQNYIQILEWCSGKAGEMAGISKQREGQVSNRETVGGVERATLQSAHSTEWLFFDHESVKKRSLECFLETAKMAFKGKGTIKKKYILDDGSERLIEFDGDEFAECDYGLAVDNSSSSQELNQNLQMYVQAGLQNGMSMATAVKTHTTRSLAEKVKIIENDEKRRQEQAQQQQQQQMQLEQQKLQQQAQIEQMKQDMQYRMHQEDNQIKILVAQINSQAEEERMEIINHEDGLTKDQELELERKKLELSAQQFRDKLALDKTKHQDDVRLKEKQINKTATKKP